MEVVHSRCAGMDVHKKVVVVCALLGRRQQTRSFGTTTEELRGLRDWLLSLGVTDAAMESTGSYWKPVFNLLEESGIDVMVVNAAHVKAVPGRKTDVNDAQWLADLLRHGLLRGSFIPDRAHRELRELVRYRRSLMQERGREVLRIPKVLEGANIKLASVASDVMGVSGRSMLDALAAGVEDAAALTALARGRLKAKHDDLLRALDGIMGAHQRFLLAEQLRHVDELEARIERLSEEIARRMLPFEAQLAALDEIPGVGLIGAQEIVAETGVDMGRFPSAGHLASWAKVSPGNNESAGKRRSGRTGKGNPWLRSTLVEAAVASVRTKNSYLTAQYRRLAARRGKKRAAMAVAHSILVIAYHILRDGVPYRDLGSDFFDRRSKDALAARMKRRLEALGYSVVIREAA
ncbi:MAG: IS110 family transposase [Actinomycetota bacterium]|nr:IS110 family transposase [Actinomycetota bacterium]